MYNHLLPTPLWHPVSEDAACRHRCVYRTWPLPRLRDPGHGSQWSLGLSQPQPLCSLVPKVRQTTGKSLLGKSAPLYRSATVVEAVGRSCQLRKWIRKQEGCHSLSCPGLSLPLPAHTSSGKTGVRLPSLLRAGLLQAPGHAGPRDAEPCTARL